MQKKYIGLIIAISIIVIISLGYITANMFGLIGTKVDMQGNTYSADGVSFDIPSDWQVYKVSEGSSKNIIIAKKISNSTQILISIAPNPKDLSNQELIDSIKNPVNEADGNWEKISNSTISINGNTAYETTFNVTNSSQFKEPIIMKEIDFIKNGYTYGLSFQAPPNDFNNELTNFNITLNSFQVK
ncbi:MAG: photosystem II reaction center PsbP family protein [Methanobacterium sp. ERen5]|nr:MAG: photosystem II reaction center PsbP family protein [Methanobacterium sp. ERen5]